MVLISPLIDEKFCVDFRLIRTPIGLEDTSKYPQLIEHLISKENWSKEEIIKLIGGNILRVLKANEDVREDF